MIARNVTLETRIKDRAYQIWEAEGRPQGRDQEHWLRAEREVNSEPGGASRAAPKRARAPRRAVKTTKH